MKKYKPGQVSAVLFTQKNGTTSPQVDNNPLAKLFSTPAKATENVTRRSLGSASNEVSLKKKRKKLISPESSIKENSLPSTEQSPTKKVKKHKPDAFVSTPVEKRKKRHLEDGIDRENPGTPKPKRTKSGNFMTSVTDMAIEEVQKGSSKSAERKAKPNKTGEDDKISRPRRDRQRDRTADTRTIFIGNCPLSVDRKRLRKIFSIYGSIETVRFRCAPPGDPNLPKRAIVITKNFHEQCNSYVAYIVFKEEKAAQKALEMNGFLLDNLHIRVDIAGSAKKHDKKRSVFVGNLPFTVGEEDIRSHFEDCGSISNIRIIRDRQTSLGKGFCYVQFESKDSVSLALKLNGSELEGRTLRVMVCVNKPKAKDKEDKEGKNNKIKEKPKVKKPSFAPSNATNTSFKNLLKTKKDKRLRKLKKKKENAKTKKSDGLSAIFGDTPAAGKLQKKKNAKLGGKGKQGKSFGPKMKSGPKGGSFRGGKGKKGKR